MKHVALFQDTIKYCWPLTIENAYKKIYGENAFLKHDYGREALFIGEYLYNHKSEFKHIKFISDMEASNEIYILQNKNYNVYNELFVWTNDFEAHRTTCEVCKVKIAEIFDGETWIIYKNNYKQELIVLGDRTETGYVEVERIDG